MKLEEIVLVKEHLKGKTMNYLLSLDDFMQIHVGRKTDSLVMGGQIALALAKTLSEDKNWMQIEFSEHKRVEARFCSSEMQLRGFLGGRFDEIDVKTVFAEDVCNAYCLDKVTNLGLRIDGSTNIKFQFTYKPVDIHFEQGDILHNFNGSDYRVLEKLSARNLLLMDVKQGSMVVAIGSGMYTKYPKGEEPTEDNQTIGLEWDHGVYLGNTPSLVDFSIIREKYGEVKEIENIDDFRSSQEDLFNFYKKIAESPILETSVKEAATNAMYDVFCTGRQEVFLNNLSGGKYDSNFIGVAPVQKEMVR